MNHAPQVKKFIVENFYVSDANALGPETSLLEGGYVDSTGMLEIVTFLEEKFSIKVAEEELVPENFETIARICAYLERKQAKA
ncbi:MAG: acyl carrier protein [Deltaproteobacteria bacterium]|nr:acyl carrier protein [Deltaproteobacteria bacterium]